MVETALGKVAGSFPACTREVLRRLTCSANCSGDWWPGPAELSQPSARRATRRKPALLPHVPLEIGRLGRWPGWGFRVTPGDKQDQPVKVRAHGGKESVS